MPIPVPVVRFAGNPGERRRGLDGQPRSIVSSRCTGGTPAPTTSYHSLYKLSETIVLILLSVPFFICLGVGLTSVTRARHMVWVGAKQVNEEMFL